MKIGGGIYEALCRCAQQSGGADFNLTFSEALKAGLSRLERKDDLRSALDRADQTALEIKMLFASLRSVMVHWREIGIPTDELFWDFDAGLGSLLQRLDTALNDDIAAVRKGI